MKEIPAERIIFNIVLIVFGIVLSMMINVFKGLYGIILPIHIPVIIAGLLLGPISGISVAVFTPILSNIFCGFPHIEELFFIGGMWFLGNIINVGDISIKSIIKIIIEQIPGMILQIIVIPPLLKKVKSGLEELYGVIS